MRKWQGLPDWLKRTTHLIDSAEVKNAKIGVVGAGSWGTAIADLLGSKGSDVNLWAYEPEVVEAIRKNSENPLYLRGHKLSSRIRATNIIHEAVANRDLVVMVVPSHHVRSVSQQFAGDLSNKTILVSASKGIENKTRLTMIDILSQTLPTVSKDRMAVLSGPSFAKEVIKRIPTAVTVASKNPETAEFVQHIFATPYFRVYTSDDVVGAEMGGAVKNVIAIAAGIIDGLGLGLNARAALITRGIAEISRLGIKLGANPLTFSGLAGIGDLILTCTGDLSRNYTVGTLIGKGKPIEEILSNMRMVAEGVKTAKSVYHLSRNLNVDMPICRETYHILYDGLSPRIALERLMTRDLKNERDEVNS